MANPTRTIPWSAVVSASVKGVSHERNGTCCQDAVSVTECTYRGEPNLVNAISDGHGGTPYIHSDRGSTHAVCAAEHIAAKFMLDAGGSIKSRQRQFEHCVRKHLRDAWINLVLQSWPGREFPEQIVRMHGATLLMTVVYRDHVHIAQLGDGEVLAIDRTGKATFLEEPEEGPISTMVTSLCGRNTERHWKFGCLPVRKVGFLMMSSDGLINSLSSTREYIRFATILEDRLHRFPRDEVQAALPRWLADISRRGSGDDVSVVALTMKTTQTNKGEKA